MNGIEIGPMRAFEAAARLGSLTAAARSLGLSQPTVSIQLAGLERRLGQRLLERRARGVRPTPAGVALLAPIRRILDDARSIERWVDEGPIAGPLRIGATDVAMIHHLPPVMESFRMLHPKVELRLVIAGSAELAGAVESRDVELAALTLPILDPPGPVRPIARDRLVWVAAANAPMARRLGVSLARIAEGPILAHKAGSVTRALVEGYFTARGLVPRVAMEVSSPEVLRKLAEGGLGLAVLPEASVREDVRRGRLAVLKTRGWSLNRITGVLTPPAGPPSRAGRAFLGLLDRRFPPSRAPAQPRDRAERIRSRPVR